MLTESEKIIITKVFDISGRNASLALSKTLGAEIEETNLYVGCTPPKSLKKMGREVALIASLGFGGKIKGDITLALPKKNTEKVVIDKLLQNMADDEKMIESAVSEIANIVVGAFFSTLSDFCNVNVLESTPKIFKRNLGFLNESFLSDNTTILCTKLRTNPKFLEYFIISIDEAESKKLIDVLKINKWKEANKVF